MDPIKMIKAIDRGERRTKAGGFALIATLLMAALLTVIVVAFAGILRIETSNSGNTELRSQARQNAILALDLAMSRLQKEAGPDQRISASSSLLDTDPTTEAIDGVNQPRWVGVWNSYDWTPNAAGAAPSPNPASAFRGWLISAPTGVDTTDRDLPKNTDLSGSESVVLLKDGSEFVRAWRVEADSDHVGRTGHYAYWVGDEGAKAKVVLRDKEAATLNAISKQSRLAVAPRTALEAVQEYEEVLESKSDVQNIGEALVKVLTRGSLSVVFGESPGFSGTFHDFTVDSTAVLSDVRKGGLKKDFSLLLEQASLPADYAGKKIYDIDYLFHDPAQTDPTNPPLAGGPKWDLIHTHYNLYKEISRDSSGTYFLDIDAYNRKIFSQGRRDYILPKVQRMQYIFGLFHDKKNYWDTATAATQPEVVYLSFYPALTLWNPYNIKIQTDQNQANMVGQFWHLPAPPVSFSFDGGGSWKRIRDVYWMYSGTMFSMGLGKYFGKAGLPVSFEPGSLQVFGPEAITRPESRFLNNNSLTTPHPAGVVRATNVRKGWDPEGPFHTFQLKGSTAADCFIPLATVSQFQLRFETKDVRLTPFTRAVFNENHGSNPLNAVGIHEFNTRTLTADPPAGLYPSFDSSQFPGLTPSAIGPISDPFLLFTFNIDFKAFPGGSKSKGQSASRLGFFSDPLADYGLISRNTLAEAQMATMELSVDRLTGGDLITTEGLPAVRIDPANNNRGYFGDYGDQIFNYTWSELPVTPLASLGQLQHVALGRDYGNPFLTTLNVYDGFNSSASGHSDGVNYSSTNPTPMAATFNRALGNSFAHPMIPANAVINGRSYDHSVYANYALIDSWYFSTITPQQSAAYTGQTRTISAVLDGYLDGTGHLPNSRLRPWTETTNASEIKARLLNSDTILPDAYKKSAAYSMVDGSFNVNSTSVKAWTAVLGGTHYSDVPYIPLSGGLQTAASSLFPFLRVSFPNFTASLPGDPSSYWKGYRELTSSQIRELATKVVEQVKRRGPFLSMADFVTRDVSSDPALSRSGALQTAIENSGINDPAPYESDPHRSIGSAEVASAAYSHQAAAEGNQADGTTPFLSQADILTPLLPSLNARSDTFVIRAYGDVEFNGSIQSRAWCEAVVQRTPEFVDNTQPAETALPALNQTNTAYGRQFRVVRFRWLTREEL